MATRRTGRPALAEKVSLDASAPLRLDDKLDTTKAKDLAAVFLARRGAALTVDASEVRHLGAQCAQVLVSARRTWAHDGQDFHIGAMSDGFGEGLRLLGLADDLGVTST